MSESLDIPPAELPGALRDFANDIGGEAYRNGDLDAFAKTLEFTPRGAETETYVKFKVEHHRRTPLEERIGVQYCFEQGMSNRLDTFPSEVLRALLDKEVDLSEYQKDEDDQDEEPPMLWREAIETYSFAQDTVNDERLIIVTHDLKFGIDDIGLLEVPVIGGKPVFMEPEEMDPPAALRLTYESDEISVMEVAQNGLLVAEGLPIDEFEEIIGKMLEDTNKAQESIRRMAGMMAILRS